MTSITTKSSRELSGDLLLGAGGRLGAMLRRFWPDPDALVLQSRQSLAGALQFDPLKDPQMLRNAASGKRAVICLAGITPAHAAQSGDALALNSALALAAIEAAPEDARILVLSSAAVYGDADGPHLETATVAPKNAYGVAKREMELAALDSGGGRVCVLRVGNVTGADAILGGWKSGMALDRLPDGRTPRRSYIGPQSLARVIYALCGHQSLPDIVNIAAPGVIGMGALLDAAGLEWSPRMPDGDVIAEVELDTSVLETFYKFEPSECTAAGMVAQWRQGDSPQ